MPILTSHAEVERKFSLYKKVRTLCRHSINFQYELPAKISFKCKFKVFYKLVSEGKYKVKIIMDIKYHLN